LHRYYDDADPRRERLRAFANAQLAPIFAQVGWHAAPGEADSVAILRDDLIRILSALGNRDVIAEAKRRYLASKSDGAAIPGALRRTILGVVARHADAETWQQLHSDAQREKTPLVKDQLYSLLGATQEQDLAQQALELSITPEPGATNSTSMIARVANLHPDLAFDFAVAHLAAVDEKLDGNSRGVFYTRLASGSADPAMIGKVNAYARAQLAQGSRRSAQTAVASIAYRIKVRNERLPEIDAWLERRVR
jgi:hypothetical protein